jgi:hypothetical protein
MTDPDPASSRATLAQARRQVQTWDLPVACQHRLAAIAPVTQLIRRPTQRAAPR